MRNIKQERRERILSSSDQGLIRLAEIGSSHETDQLIALIDKLLKEIDRVQSIVSEE